MPNNTLLYVLTAAIPVILAVWGIVHITKGDTTKTISTAEWLQLMKQNEERYNAEMRKADPSYKPQTPRLTQPGDPKGRTNWGLKQRRGTNKKNQPFKLPANRTIIELVGKSRATGTEGGLWPKSTTRNE